jgi:hypothetical protein
MVTLKEWGRVLNNGDNPLTMLTIGPPCYNVDKTMTTDSFQVINVGATGCRVR